MSNVFGMMAIVILGLAMLYFLRKNLEGLRLSITVAIFIIARTFWGMAWRSLSPDLQIIRSDAMFRLLVINLFTMSFLFVLGMRFLLGRSLTQLGWDTRNCLRNTVIGILLGSIMFILFHGGKPIQYSNAGMAFIFSFPIASWQEENLFRGFLLEYLKKRLHMEEAIVAQALLFSLAHLGFYMGLPLIRLLISLVIAFGIGVVLGFIKEATKSQITGFICHGLVDLGMLI